jgi:hypothetical protein
MKNPNICKILHFICTLILYYFKHHIMPTPVTSEVRVACAHFDKIHAIIQIVHVFSLKWLKSTNAFSIQKCNNFEHS